jgi:DNA-binding PadR family transcriptional regulator
MSTRLVLLALLRDKPLHGYELKHIIEEHMGDWTNIAFGSIYFALNKLKTGGFVERAGEEKVGNRPSRRVYKITDKGKKEFLSLLRESWRTYEREYHSLDIALAFSDALPKAEVAGYMTQRINLIEKIIQHIEEHGREQTSRPEVPKIARAIFSHSAHHFKAELAWLKETLADFENIPAP